LRGYISIAQFRAPVDTEHGVDVFYISRIIGNTGFDIWTAVLMYRLSRSSHARISSLDPVPPPLKWVCW
jgi:hypothetical protein